MSATETIELRSNTGTTGADVPNWQDSTAPSDPDSIVEASRIADASVPDGGYGWVIVASCSTMCFWFVGTSKFLTKFTTVRASMQASLLMEPWLIDLEAVLTYSWGVIQAALIENKVASPSTLSFVGSLAVACNAAFAIPNGRLTRALGARKVALLGVSLMGLGQILSGFSQSNIGGLFITAGLMMGYGYFSRRRGLANGLVFAGGGLGGAIISLSMSAIVERLGTAWAFRLVGLLMWATGLPMAWLIRERAPVKTATFIDLSLFRDFKFVMVFLVGAVATFPLCVPPFFLPLYARSLGFSPYTGAALVAGFNFSSAIGRIATGFMGDKLGPLNSLFATLMLSALSMLCLWPVSSSLGPLVAFVIVNGIGNGGFFSVMPTVVSNVFGSVRVSVAMGAVVTSWTGGYLMGAPIAGYLLDAYGGETAGFKAYRPAIFYAGSLALLSAGLVALLRLRMSKSPLKRL
ncbi:uncharacterized protein HMPREF1541_06114 [Cyphellophora europaea CBS 101466]|uniref:Major facilitator superfamily (MFS) profile domain-containing protein n=1 Tax=Cyphellophora europaea (strain CBS 101466) TaxID=1220924 RepID=W2RVW5_CYPE1|nr:uncharacterized protein HMPREF1541_06114 [Cyphellophora europaea CBS 101466]ETN39888.1 hypothetical protein HMPREF1541_06114 [Cyphellophora europaea CBS 101466]